MNILIKFLIFIVLGTAATFIHDKHMRETGSVQVDDMSVSNRLLILLIGFGTIVLFFI
jgi:hypothetical protein